MQGALVRELDPTRVCMLHQRSKIFVLQLKLGTENFLLENPKLFPIPRAIEQTTHKLSELKQCHVLISHNFCDNFLVR